MRTIALCFTIVGLLLLLPTLCTLHYVVFEEVGQVATSVSYLHITLPLNLTSLSKLTKDHLEAITKTKNIVKMVKVENPKVIITIAKDIERFIGKITMKNSSSNLSHKQN